MQAKNVRGLNVTGNEKERSMDCILFMENRLQNILHLLLHGTHS